MPDLMGAARAYNAASAYRSDREQEADTFRRATAALRLAKTSASPTARARAVADNTILWNTVINLLSDPLNRLPDSLRASIISVGLAVKRDMESTAPNFDFLIAINDNIAAGLSGQI